MTVRFADRWSRFPMPFTAKTFEVTRETENLRIYQSVLYGSADALIYAAQCQDAGRSAEVDGSTVTVTVYKDDLIDFVR